MGAGFTLGQTQEERWGTLSELVENYRKNPIKVRLDAWGLSSASPLPRPICRWPTAAMCCC